MDNTREHQSPFSNVDVVILANRSREAFSDSQLFGLLTIANKPILAHVLDQFERFNFGKIKLVCLSKDQSAYADFLFSNSSRSVQLIPVDGAQTTCDIIRKIASQMNHVFIFPIDLFISVNLTEIVDYHISSHTQITVISTRQGLDEKDLKAAPGIQVANLNQNAGKRFFVYDEAKPNVLVTLLSDITSLNEDIDLSLKRIDSCSAEEDYSQDDYFDYSQDAMSVHPSHLKGVHSLIVDSSMMLTNAFLLSPECVTFLRENNIHSIESELIPQICTEPKQPKKINASLYCAKPTEFAFRVTDYASLFVANMKCASTKLLGYSPAADFTLFDGQNNGYFKEDPHKVPETFKYTPFSVYGAYLTVLSDDVQIQRSVIGKHCKIGKGVKIFSSILFDHVTIDDGVVLRDCMIGSDSVIKSNSRLTLCIVSPRYTSEKGMMKERCIVQVGEK
ncbi:hypothetical protein TRFO_27169 [Tritrichomonas foetus]|uniref:Translation initiation factor eIF2B subunit gamma n=1 Tax=Tritrichomonas foetus TaxID=1144522 RepID=A0A1J4K6A9_9EUKA|nr:hypothetical protein TRFO_27169 [Tritrichomonas foetus]|eukprot:OHT05222.1 hypothetical protein TRFO_27169 [Tritrichomonas foetus]